MGFRYFVVVRAWGKVLELRIESLGSRVQDLEFRV